MTLLEEPSLYALFTATFLGASFLPAAGLPVLILCVLTRNDFASIFLMATLGNWLGAVLSFYLGAALPLRQTLKIFRIKETALDRTTAWFEKFHILSAVGCGIPVVGDRISLVLGLFRTPVVPTISLMLVGKMLRYGALIPLIYFGVKFS